MNTSHDPTPDPVTDVIDAITDKFAGDEHQRLDPENNLIGALMYHPADKVARLLDYVDDDDIEKVLPQAVLAVIRQLVHRGRDPDPMTVSAALRDPHRVPGPFDPDNIPARYQRLQRYIQNVYANGLNVGPRSAAYQVVDDAYRRHFGRFGLSLAQRADAYADTQDLEQYAADAITQWRRFHHRLRTLARGLPDTEHDTHPHPERPIPELD
ncbi:hypothetical protein [Nocardia brasiliensis]|uniref:hypothetical protein n=1 Tax=Nocardia brasiliensis TaxID=37326 RepID=UPI003D8BEA69